jgi:post-segregation antitoxin (ccd killing protein)
MARVNIYLPDDLAKHAREAGLNVSGIAQEALERELAARATNEWLEQLQAADLPATTLSSAELLEIMDDVRVEFGRAADKYREGPHRSHS